MAQSLTELPRLRQPAILNAAEYWLAPERFARHCQAARRPLRGCDAGARGLAVPHRSRRHQGRVHRGHQCVASRRRAGQGQCAPTGPRPHRADERRWSRAHAPPADATAPVPRPGADQLPGRHAAQDRGDARALALRPRDPVRRPHAGDLAGGDHGRRLRRHRPRPRRAAARGDARVDARGQLASASSCRRSSRAPARTAGTGPSHASAA